VELKRLLRRPTASLAMTMTYVIASEAKQSLKLRAYSYLAVNRYQQEIKNPA